MESPLLKISEAKSRLFLHKSLWDLWCASWRLGVDWKEILFSLFIGLCIFLTAVASPLPVQELISQSRLLVNDSLTFGATILGFLIAGFTIFATITRPEIFVLMARWSDGTNTTHLQKVFLYFMKIFAHYCAFCLVCVLLKVLASPMGFASLLAAKFSMEIKLWFVVTSLSVFSAWFVYLLLLLPIFVFNLYQIQLVVIDFTMQEQSQEECDDEISNTVSSKQS